MRIPFVEMDAMLFKDRFIPAHSKHRTGETLSRGRGLILCIEGLRTTADQEKAIKLMMTRGADEIISRN